MARPRIDIPSQPLTEFCRRWRVSELSIFGSALRGDFQPDSDIDVLVSFEQGAPYGIDEHVEMVEELRALFGRKVDLVTVSSLRNPFRRHEILSSREILYAA